VNINKQNGNRTPDSVKPAKQGGLGVDFYHENELDPEIKLLKWAGLKGEWTVTGRIIDAHARAVDQLKAPKHY